MPLKEIAIIYVLLKGYNCQSYSAEIFLFSKNNNNN